MEFANPGQTKRDNDTLRDVVQAVMTVREISPLIKLASQRGWCIAGVITQVKQALKEAKTNAKDTQT